MKIPVLDRTTLTKGSALRRLAFMMACLFVFDLFVPSILQRLEAHHYEERVLFRFENSDLFALGPAVAYLREHPRASRRRVIFLGNSMTFGYLLAAGDTLPAQFAKRRLDTRVFNMGINSQELGTSYLVGKAIIDSVDVLFVQTVGETANPILASLIPVDDSDSARFHLTPPNRLERQLRALLGRVWRLYGANERLQAAMFGTSTREYIYLHHRDILLRIARPGYKPAPAPAMASGGARPVLRVPLQREAPAAQHIAGIPNVLIDFAELARTHKRRVVFIQYEYANRGDDTAAAQFNAAYAPFAEMMIVQVPQTLTIDGQHLNEEGCRLVAEALDENERKAAGAR